MRTEDFTVPQKILATTAAPALAALLCLSLGFPRLAIAAPADGVRCPNGYETLFDSAGKTLRCQRSQTTYRPAVCDPKFDDHIVYRVNRGHDVCLRVADATSAARSSASGETRGRPVICSIDSSEKTQWSIEVDPNAQDRDRCKATLLDWIYPSQQ